MAKCPWNLLGNWPILWRKRMNQVESFSIPLAIIIQYYWADVNVWLNVYMFVCVTVVWSGSWWDWLSFFGRCDIRRLAAGNRWRRHWKVGVLLIWAFSGSFVCRLEFGCSVTWWWIINWIDAVIDYRAIIIIIISLLYVIIELYCD